MIVAIMLAGCGESGKLETTSQLPAESAPTTREPSIALASVGLKSVNDSNAEAWPTELITKRVGEQLNRLKAALKAGGSLPNGLFSKKIQFEAIRPDQLETVFEDAQMLVLRANGTATRKSGVAELSRSLAPYTGFQAAFKLFGIESLTDTARTTISVSLSNGTQQESATWICDWTQDDPPLLQSLQVHHYESTVFKTQGDTPERAFNDCTEAVFADVQAYEDQLAHGIDHWVARIESAFGINVSGWEGLALGDVNSDGLDDVYVCQPGGLPNRLFIQKSDGSVFDASSFAGVDWRLQTQSALLADLDNDGDQDLTLATTLGLIFMANDGRGTFTTQTNILIPEAAPLGLSCADIDLDGDLDVFATCYSRRRSSAKSAILGRPIPYHDANNGGRNALFRNDRNWKFTNATLELGLDENNRRFSFAASWEDYDNDGDQDLYVANDYGRNNLYRNDRDSDGTHRFVDVAKQAGVEDISAGMSVSWSDYNMDGHMDLYISNMWSSAGNRVTYQRQFQSKASTSTLTEMRKHARGNSLFKNQGDGTFLDVSEAQGVTQGRWAWGSRFVDLNTDGWDDLLVTNGFITQPQDSGDL